MLKGSCAALVTPFLPNGEIDFECYGRIIDFHVKNGTAGIVVLGTTGEAPAIKEDEREALISFAVRHAAGRLPVVVGCSGGDTEHAKERCVDAERLGADAALLLTPYYNKANSRGMVAHFRVCAESVNLPIIMYNVPGRTGCTLTLAEIAELKKCPNIAGIKEASGNMGFFARVCALADENFAVYCGSDEMNVPALAAGASGLISVLANIFPRECADMCAYMEKGEVAAARVLQHRYSSLIAALFSEPNPIPVKTAMNELCIDGVGTVGGLRLPLCEMGEGNKRALLKALAECRMKNTE
ncbi:MAG: 4-hydroxy-tetrahydrodipicolinate synthase [Clostridia bacterium]|nr:4-hydroxy-tetrahydrodipicolinate synthase [Clostridia bacterium]